MIIKLMIDGGDMKPGPAIAQQLGPMKIPIGNVISDVNKATKEFKGMQVPVHLDVDAKTKKYTIKILSPPTSGLLKKELGIESGTGARKKSTVGNLAIEQVISVAKVKSGGMLAKDFISALKSVIGSALSLGVLIENKDPKEILRDIEAGKYKDEIKNQKTDLSPEKKKKLLEFFQDIKNKQEAQKKKEEEEVAAAEAAKAAAATAKPGEAAAAGATPAAAGATPAAATPVAGAKPAAKK
jgi:large subunit ribosomal protein L11